MWGEKNLLALFLLVAGLAGLVALSGLGSQAG